ncbi:hypothetical protein [Kribbella sp. NPDC048928]|uniref:hypothetical protein n=1 Tax=Kribbella sp. NPDC048928 TaxID=3364111 RepID=UPI003711D721
MFEGDLRDLATAELLSAASEFAQIQDRAAVRILESALTFADRHAVVPGYESLPGYERLQVYGGDGCPGVAEFAPIEFGAVLSMSSGAAAALIGEALALRHRLPRIWAKVLAGDAVAWRARKVAHACLALSLEAAAIVDRRVARIVNTVTPGALGKIIAAAVWDADPEQARAQAEATARERGVFVAPSDDHGTKRFWVRAAAGDVIRFDATIDDLARALKTLGDTDSLNELRAKAIGWIADPAAAHQLLAVARHLAQTARSTPTPAPAGPAPAGPTPARPAPVRPVPVRPVPADSASERVEPAGTEPDHAAPDHAAPDHAASDRPGPEPAGDSDDGPSQTEPSSPSRVEPDSGRRVVRDSAQDGRCAAGGAADEATEPAHDDRLDDGLDDAGAWAGEGEWAPSEDSATQDSARADPPAANAAEVDVFTRRMLAAELPARLAAIKQEAYRTGLGPTSTGRQTRQTRHTLYVHLTDRTLATGTGVLRVEELGPLLASQLTELLGHDHITIKPVIDLHDQVSVHAYEIPDRIRERVRLRHPVDTFPYSAAEATERMDQDHITPYNHTTPNDRTTPYDRITPYDRTGPPNPTGPPDQPGQTSTNNLIPLTRLHHRAKTFGAWRNRRLPDGAIEWTSPHGFTFIVNHTGTHPAPTTTHTPPT